MPNFEALPIAFFFLQSTRVAVWLDLRTIWLLGVVLGLLLTAYVVGRVLRRQPETFVNPAVVRTFNKRVQAWWLMATVLIAGFIMGRGMTILVFGLISFWALREYVTMTPTRRGDHRALFWTFFVLTPLQFVLVWIGQSCYGLYSILIPVYASLFIPARIAFAGDQKRFLERSAKIQAGLLICVYSLSYAPALLDLQLCDSGTAYRHRTAKAERTETAPMESVDPMATPGEQENASTPRSTSTAGLLFFFVLIAQLGDILTYGWGQLLGKHVIAPTINATKTWEGFIGGSLSTTLVGALLCWATPFYPWEAACMALAVAVMGFAGSMTMSAVKRDRGVRDYGTLVTGHAGVLDRIDSICFAAPVFFHLTRYFFSKIGEM